MLAIALALAVAFLALPVLAIFVHTSPRRLWASLGDAQSREALRLSLETSAIAIAVVVAVGTPAAYAIARHRFRGRTLLMTVIELPLVLPPAVAGIGLLASVGPDGILGGTLADLHISLALNTAAVVTALAFVASPYYLRQAQAAFEALDGEALDAARVLGAGEATVLRRVAIPLARPGLLAGLALAWGRALGEFGATLMFAGSFEGITQTAPLAIYDRFASDFPAALSLSAVLVIVSGAVLLTVKLAVGSPAAHPR
jgi:molybdate transport system permease protein